MKNKNKNLTDDLNDFKDMLKENMSDEYKNAILTLNILQLQRELITINCVTQAIIRTLLDTEGSIFTKETLDKLDIERNGDEIIFTVEARSFIYHQVRNMVGTLQEVGHERLKPEDVKTILEACDRTKAGISAPACGLYLNKVMY